MPHTKSAVKHLRTDEKRRVCHKSKRGELKTLEKKFREAIKGSDKTGLQKLFSLVCSRIDKAAKDRTIHKNKADRKKSQLAALGAKALKEVKA